jgi:two-component system, NtrC family, sensor histidine kinase HydH
VGRQLGEETMPDGDGVDHDTGCRTYHRLKWLMLCRLIFSILLLGSTVLFQLGEGSSFLARPLVALYGLTAGIFLLSFFYGILLQRVRRKIILAYAQLIADTLIVTLIIFLTGSFSSLFPFLYMVVIIYSSMLLYRQGCLVVATCCAVGYTLLVGLDFFAFLTTFGISANPSIASYGGAYVLYKLAITVSAFYAVAVLSCMLSEQVRKSRLELQAMADHVKRVKRVAAIGEMAAGLAHEIKNPLAALTGSIQLLREDLHLAPDHQRLMAIILREADRLSSLVTNFLLFARPPAAKAKPIELGPALLAAVELFEKDRSFSGRIAISKDVCQGLWVEMDPMHLQQVCWNLLLNAAEAIGATGHVRVSVSAISKRQACVRISDDGCGMTAATIKSIFDPFFTTKPSGTGLGLSIVQRILEPYRTRLAIESKPNCGSTFCMTFDRIPPPTCS